MMKKLFKRTNVFGEIIYTPLYRLLLSFSLLVGLLAVFTILILVFEKGHNEGLDSAFESIWYGHAVFTTIGFGDVTPVTTAGKTVTMLFSIIGAVLIVSMGRSLDDALFGHTDNDIANVELRHYLKQSIDLDERNEKLNKNILSRLESVEDQVSVLKTLT